MSQKVASLYAEIGANTTGFERGAGKVKSGLNDMGGAFRSVLPPGITQFLSLGGAVTAVGLAVKNTLDTTIEYANQVRELSMLSGESTEESSRFIQVLDDYKISAEDALVATRALTKEGHTPSIQTLAELSDQYLSLNNAQERNAFVLKNLGRGGLQWAEVLSKGSAALLAQGAAVEKSLILSKQQTEAARRNELAVDRWNDSMMAAKINIGNGLLPVMTKTVNHTNAVTEADRRLTEQGIKPMTAEWYKLRPALIEAVKAEQAAQDATTAQTIALQDQVEASDELKKAISDRLKDQLSLIGSIQDAENSYEENAKSLTDERIQLEQERAEKIKQGYSEQGDVIKEIDGKLAENSQASADNAAQHELDTKKIVLGYLEQQLAADGLTQAEMDFLLKKGEAWGIYTADVVREAKDAQIEVQNYINKLNGIPVHIMTTLELQELSPFANPAPSSKGKRKATPFAAGGSFIVPAAFGNEGFSMGGIATASAGEKVTISSGGSDSGTADMLAANMATLRALPNAIARALRQNAKYSR